MGDKEPRASVWSACRGELRLELPQRQHRARNHSAQLFSQRWTPKSRSACAFGVGLEPALTPQGSLGWLVLPVEFVAWRVNQFAEPSGQGSLGWLVVPVKLVAWPVNQFAKASGRRSLGWPVVPVKLVAWPVNQFAKPSRP